MIKKWKLYQLVIKITKRAVQSLMEYLLKRNIWNPYPILILEFQ